MFCHSLFPHRKLTVKCPCTVQLITCVSVCLSMSDHLPNTRPYRGRFAPSPSGCLHAGSLMTAVGSYLEARCRNGEWLVRIEDLDSPRTVPGAAEQILRQLERLGFEWDGPVLWQHQRHDHYQAALAELKAKGRAYPCACTRRQIQARAARGIDGPVYPGTCRQRKLIPGSATAWRFACDEETLLFHDRVQGIHQQSLARDIGDFVLRRADGIWAYQLAVVVDDAAQGITDVVRGADLLVSTPRQLALQQALGLPPPSYCHLPVLVNAAGEKLSKQTLAPAIAADAAADALRLALMRLGHAPPSSLASLNELWRWAKASWQLTAVPRGPVVLHGTL